jgi:PleD family two-component response regulator
MEVSGKVVGSPPDAPSCACAECPNAWPPSDSGNLSHFGRAGSCHRREAPLEVSALPTSVNPTLLIVDDEKHTREGLRASLEDSFDVYIAADIAGALGVLEREHVDLVLTDLRIGGEDGMTLIDKILALPHPPIIIMMTA